MRRMWLGLEIVVTGLPPLPTPSVENILGLKDCICGMC